MLFWNDVKFCLDDGLLTIAFGLGYLHTLHYYCLKVVYTILLLLPRTIFFPICIYEMCYAITICLLLFSLKRSYIIWKDQQKKKNEQK